MNLRTIQQLLESADARTPHPFRSAAEIVVALTEELGEVATEVALLERVGSKAGWSKQPSAERLASELVHLLNLACLLASRYGIDLEQAYQAADRQAAPDPGGAGPGS